MKNVGSFFQCARIENKECLKSRDTEFRSAALSVENFLISKFPDLKFQLVCSVERLNTAVVSYFYDIHRYKHFHGMLDDEKNARINFPKIYAFTAKWLMKERPFYLRNESGAMPTEDFMTFANYINEYIFIAWMKASFKSQIGVDINIPAKEAIKICYSLKFRDVSTTFFELYLSTKFPEVPKELEKKAVA